MGMSASQARFLCLTARKSNVEFEGQQINQQRTTLSNESGAYYSELCNLVVPTPPSIDDYTKVSYTFDDGALTNTITAMIAKGNNEYSISYIQQWQDDYSIVSASSSIIARNPDVESATVSLVECTEDDIKNFEYYYIDEALGTATQYTRNPDNTFSDSDGNVVPGITEDNLIICLYDASQKDPEHAVLMVGKDAETGKYIKETYNYDYAYKIGSAELRKVGTFDANKVESDPYLSTLSEAEINDLMEQETYYLQLLNEKNGTKGSNDPYYVRYIKDANTGAYVPYFYKASDIENDRNYLDNLSSAINCYTVGSAVKTKEVLNQKGSVEKDSTGRYLSITLVDEETGNNITYNLVTNTTTDDAAYNDAMNKYNYEQHRYNQKVQDINSKIEIVQQQDKSLELKLKQLDTEENAINQELDAVKKVITNNVEKSFKTFNA